MRYYPSRLIAQDAVNIPTTTGQWMRFISFGLTASNARVFCIQWFMWKVQKPTSEKEGGEDGVRVRILCGESAVKAGSETNKRQLLYSQLPSTSYFLFENIVKIEVHFVVLLQLLLVVWEYCCHCCQIAWKLMKRRNRLGIVQITHYIYNVNVKLYEWTIVESLKSHWLRSFSFWHPIKPVTIIN